MYKRQGRLVETGSHEKLMAAGGEYAQMQALSGPAQRAEAGPTADGWFQREPVDGGPGEPDG